MNAIRHPNALSQNILFYIEVITVNQPSRNDPLYLKIKYRVNFTMSLQNKYANCLVELIPETPKCFVSRDLNFVEEANQEHLRRHQR